MLNAPYSAGFLNKVGNIYTGVLPGNINIANTAIKWGGTLWAMIMLPLPENMNISFDPHNLMPVEGYGTVYPTLRLSDNLGILTVTEGALLGTNWDIVTLSEPAVISQEKVTRKGWTIDLNKGFVVEKDSSGKNYLIKKK